MLAPDRTKRTESPNIVIALRFPHTEIIRKLSSVFVYRCYDEKKKGKKRRQRKEKKEQCFFENLIVTVIIH